MLIFHFIDKYSSLCLQSLKKALQLNTLITEIYAFSLLTLFFLVFFFYLKQSFQPCLHV